MHCVEFFKGFSQTLSAPWVKLNELVGIRTVVGDIAAASPTHPNFCEQFGRFFENHDAVSARVGSVYGRKKPSSPAADDGNIIWSRHGAKLGEIGGFGGRGI